MIHGSADVRLGKKVLSETSFQYFSVFYEMEKPYLFTEISSYIRENYGENISISEVADLYELNTNQLYYIFSKHLNMGPGEYLIEYRLNRAKEFILTTELPIQEISNAVGYADPLYFSRLFKRKFGTAPTGLRKTVRNNPY